MIAQTLRPFLAAYHFHDPFSYPPPRPRFQQWPEDALEAVAAQFLRGVDLPEDQRAHVKQMCKMFHTSVTEASAAFLAQSGRHNYVTPTSYLELITAFTTLLSRRRGEVSGREEI